MSRSNSRRPVSPRNRPRRLECGPINSALQGWLDEGAPERLNARKDREARAANVVNMPKPDRWGALIPANDRGELGFHDVVLIDPPWPTATYSAKGRKKMPTYETVTIDELMQLGRTIRSLLAKDCVALVWVTAPQLSNAMMIIAQWGLSYRTYRVWKKKRMGTGYWTRSNGEILLICTRGKPKAPRMGKQGTSIFEAPAKDKRHSSKPVCMHEWLEEHYPNARKLELFARDEREGWTTYGGDLGTWITPEGIRDMRVKFPNARRAPDVVDAEVIPFPAQKAKRARKRK